MFVGVVPIIGLWIAMTSARAVGRRRATALLLLFLAVFGAPLVWWSGLQSAHYGRAIVLTDKGTATLALGSNWQQPTRRCVRPMLAPRSDAGAPAACWRCRQCNH